MQVATRKRIHFKGIEMIVYNCVTLVLLSLLPHIHNKLIADGLRSKLASLSVCLSAVQNVLTTLESFDFIMLSRILTNDTDEYTNTFLKPSFSVQVDKVKYHQNNSAVNYVNNLISTKTLQRLKYILNNDDINNRTSLMLVSAVYFKMTWEIPFDLKKTRISKFRGFDRNISLVPMMSQDNLYLFLIDDGLGLKMIDIKLATQGLSMFIVLPDDANSMAYFLSSVLTEPNFIRSIKNRMKLRMLTLNLPRFKIKSLVNWKWDLQQMGLQKIFLSNETGLDSALKNNTKRHLYVSGVKQKTFIEVDEMGVLRGDGLRHEFERSQDDIISMTNPTLEFTADKPFYFSILIHYDLSDYKNTEDLLNGVYYGPQ
ncbi:unnamed protein product [Leptidea sinapis]|uniref:Serpin domain-containing protein n=1 Tax=Leptidea sinapis TaxID=189913 RepID=A0A5E4Q0K8_9NEOP|nr:unnamed protein product [Leptidea sinapis]